MEVLILKTNVSSRKKVGELSHIFDNHAAIERWSVDTEDRHNVMRIVAGSGFEMSDAIELIQAQGFTGHELDC